MKLNQAVLLLLAIALTGLTTVSAFAQKQDKKTASELKGPIKDVTYHVVLLVESDDQNRHPYNGPARDGLTEAGYDRLIIAGSATAMVTIGQTSTVTGTSRYGQLSVATSLLNTTEENELQIKVSLQTRNQSPITIDTSARAPMGRWFLVGATDSRVGLPKHAADGKRAVAVMRIDDGVLVLD
jgi:hypothetical protein